jgi:hypothetical protein
MKIEAFLGFLGKLPINRLWPEATEYHILKATTGEVVKNLTIPGQEWYPSLSMSSYPDPTGKGLILQNDKSLAYWEFHTQLQWYPWIGLCIGLLFSVLVARWNLRQPVHRRLDTR